MMSWITLLTLRTINLQGAIAQTADAEDVRRGLWEALLRAERAAWVYDNAQRMHVGFLGLHLFS